MRTFMESIEAEYRRSRSTAEGPGTHRDAPRPA